MKQWHNKLTDFNMWLVRDIRIVLSEAATKYGLLPTPGKRSLDSKYEGKPFPKKRGSTNG